MVRNKLGHCLLGLTVAALAFLAIFWLQVSPGARILLWVVVAVGLVWAWIMGHAWMVIPALLVMPFAILSYVLISPVKLRGDRALEETAEILAYCVLPDRIILVREFPASDVIEGHSLFLPKRVARVVQERLAKSTALMLSIDEVAASRAFGSPLPSLAEFDRTRMGLASIDDIHHLVGELWGKHKNSEMRDDILHLAAWYSLAADSYYRHAERSWVDHALL